MTTLIIDHQERALEAGLRMLHSAMGTGRMKCLNCLWSGTRAECNEWGADPICPECGGNVEEVTRP